MSPQLWLLRKTKKVNGKYIYMIDTYVDVFKNCRNIPFPFKVQINISLIYGKEKNSLN